MADAMTVDQMVEVLLTLRRAPQNEQRAKAAWSLVAREQRATPQELAAFAKRCLADCAEYPDYADLRRFLRERRHSCTLSRLVHCYDANGMEWLRPAEDVDGVCFFSDDQWMARRKAMRRPDRAKVAEMVRTVVPDVAPPGYDPFE
ncbi:MAG: hypothetical protein WHU10_00130 [Fimbriimonadales bacterium]